MIKVIACGAVVLFMFYMTGKAVANKKRLEDTTISLKEFQFDVVNTGRGCYKDGKVVLDQPIDPNSFLCAD